MAKSCSLNLHPGKCVALRFGRVLPPIGPYEQYFIGDTPIPFTNLSKDLGVMIDTKLKFHDHIRSVASKAGGVASNLLKSTLCRSRDFMMALYTAHVRPLLEFSSVVWNTGYIGDIKLLESVQRRWTRSIDGLENLSYAERLSALDLFSVHGRLLRADLIECWKIMHGVAPFDPTSLFKFAPDVGTRGHVFKLAHIRCSLGCRRRFFSVRVVDSWNLLPSAVVELRDLGAFKAALKDFLGHKLYDYYP